MKRIFYYFNLLAVLPIVLTSCGGDEEPAIDCTASGLSASVVSTTNALCDTEGALVVSATGGAAPYTYSIDGTAFVSTATFSALVAGNYTITVRDANDCTATVAAAVDAEQGSIAVTVGSTIDQTCTEGGTITASATGGEGAVEFSINGTTFQTSGTFTGLTAGSYTVTAKDANGCVGTTAATVGADENTVTFTTQLTDSGCGTSDGAISVSVTGGDGNYTYKFDEGNFSSSSQKGSLAAGSHSVTVKDGSGCEVTENVSVLSGVSYASSVKTIIDTECATSGCHVSGTGRQNFTVFATVQANAAGIKSRTQSGDMPRNGTLSQEEKDLIACWVDDGAKNN